MSIALSRAYNADHASAELASTEELSEADLDKLLFFDSNLSLNRNMLCSTCHDPDHAFSDQRLSKAHGAVLQGSNGELYGIQNAPTASYASTSPTFHFN